MPTYTEQWGEPKLIAKVARHLDYFTIAFEDGSMFSLEAKHQVEPKVGDTVRQRLRKTYILGLMINEREIFNQSDEDYVDLQTKENAAYEAKLKENFEASRDQMDKDFARLPKAFQKKIERLRSNNPDFRWRYEIFELFIAKEAIKISSQLKTFERIGKFMLVTSDEIQKKLVPNLQYAKHTAHSFETACKSAIFFVSNPKLFHLTHGAMDSLVGCLNYGCPVPTDREIEEAENADG